MEKKFHYKNGVVRIIVPDNYSDKTIYKATEDFMRKVIEIKIKESNQNGNKHTTRDLKEKPILD